MRHYLLQQRHRLSECRQQPVRLSAKDDTVRNRHGDDVLPRRPSLRPELPVGVELHPQRCMWWCRTDHVVVHELLHDLVDRLPSPQHDLHGRPPVLLGHLRRRQLRQWRRVLHPKRRVLERLRLLQRFLVPIRHLPEGDLARYRQG